MRSNVRILLLVCTLLLSIAPALGQDTATVAPSKRKIKTIYVIPSSHWDLGFIVPPEEILPKLKPHIDEVIANCKADPEFRWTIESVWQIRAWLDRTDDPKLMADFADLVKKGQIQVSAVWGSTHTEFMGTEQMNRLVYDMKDLQRRFGITSDFAMMNDVPGFTQRLPQVLARSGVKYFLNGSNTPFGGGTSLYPGKIPFYWASPDGSRVLMWQTQGKNGGYPEGMADYFIDPVAGDPYHVIPDMHFYPKEWNGLPPLEIMQRGVDKLLKQYEDVGYPWDAALVMYLHDFIPSSWERDQLLPNVRAWNAAGKQPKIVVANPGEFFHYMESKYGDKLQTRAGDWSGLWTEVKTNSPAMSANARWVHDHAPVAEMIWSLLSFQANAGYPGGNIETARLNLLKYDEHSGAGQYGWPKIMTRADVEQQNREYAAYTSGAKQEVQQLLSAGVQALLEQKQDSSSQATLAVFNPLSWERSGTVRAKVPGRTVQLRDLATHKLVTAQRVSSDEVEFVAEALPPVGYRTYAIEKAAEAERPSSPATGGELESDYYTLKLRPSDGAILSIFDKQLRRELVDPNAPNNVGQLLRWSGLRMLPQSFGTVSLQHERGAVTDSMVITRPGTYWPETRISLPLHRKSIEIEQAVDRSRMPYVASAQEGEAYGFSFPFKFTGSSQLWIDNGIGFYRFPEDLLPGARNDAAVVQHAIVMESRNDPEPFHVVMTQSESFFDYVIRFPGSNGGPGNFLNEVRPAAIRKVDQGETRDLGIVSFPTSEPGMGPVYRYCFSVTSAAGALNPVASYRAGVEFDIPPLVAELAAGMRPPEDTGWYFSISAPNVVITGFKPSADGEADHYMLRLQEIAGQKTEFKMSTKLQVTAIQETSMTEDEAPGSVHSFGHMSIGPNQTLTLKLTLPHKTNDWRVQ